MTCSFMVVMVVVTVHRICSDTDTRCLGIHFRFLSSIVQSNIGLESLSFGIDSPNSVLLVFMVLAMALLL
jgi:hypothetical protein